MTTQNINMDLVPGGNSKVIRVSQYDHESRTYKITLTHNNKNDFTIPEGVTVEVRGTKPSGKSFVYPCTFEGNVVTLVIKDQMTAEHGTVKAEIVLVKGTTRLGAGNFDIIVEKASFTPGNITNSDTFDSLVEDAVVKCANENLIELYVDVELNPESDAPVGNKVICNNFANAIKGYVAGSTITADDVSPVKHTLSVNVHGKNLIKYPHQNTSKTQNGLTFTDNGDGSITVVGTATEVTYYDLCKFTSRFFSGENRYFNAMGNVVTFEGYTLKDCSVQQRESGNSFCHLVITKGQTINKTYYPQVEKGTIATDYEPWLDPIGVTLTDGSGETYVPNEDGVVDGVVSTSPIMTLSTDNADFNIECEYIRDSTKVIEKLTNAIIALGGSV